jgi:hypothetical protein
LKQQFRERLRCCYHSPLPGSGQIGFSDAGISDARMTSPRERPNAALYRW